VILAHTGAPPAGLDQAGLQTEAGLFELHKHCRGTVQRFVVFSNSVPKRSCPTSELRPAEPPTVRGYRRFSYAAGLGVAGADIRWTAAVDRLVAPSLSRSALCDHLTFGEAWQWPAWLPPPQAEAKGARRRVPAAEARRWRRWSSGIPCASQMSARLFGSVWAVGSAGGSRRQARAGFAASRSGARTARRPWRRPRGLVAPVSCAPAAGWADPTFRPARNLTARRTASHI
jgi:hypothetical protein